MSFNSRRDGGVTDLIAGLKHTEYWAYYAWHDVKQRYKRSALGPFWITISMSITIVGQAILFGLLFGQSLADYLPYIAAGQITWALIVSFITDGQQTFIGMTGVAKNVRLPLSVHYYKFALQQVILFAHNVVPLIVVQILLHRHDFTIGMLLILIPCFALLMVNLLWLGLAIAIVSSRFRDLGTVISSIVQLAFFITPIIWPISQIHDKVAAKGWDWNIVGTVISLNPFYQMMEIVREPMLASYPHTAWLGGTWAYMIVMAIVGWTVTLLGYRKTYRRIVYWL